MKLRPMFASALLIAAFPAAAAAAPLPELLKPVDPAAAAKLMAPSNYDFRIQRQAAKRFRIVELNLAVLNQEGAVFTITPFKDLAVAVITQTTSREPKQERLREWVGVPDRAENVALGSQGEPVKVPEQSVSLWVSEGPREVPLKVARKIALDEGDRERLQMLPESSDAPDAPVVTTRLNVVTVSGQWIARPGVEVVLEPIVDDPRFHFVYEIDHEKMPNSVHGGADTERKLRAQRAYYEQIETERAEAAASKP